MKDEFIGMNIKQKSENKNTKNEYRCILKSNFVDVNRLLLLIYLNRDSDAEQLKAPRYYLSKGIIKNYRVIVNKNKLWLANSFCYKKIHRNKKF